LNGNY